MTGVGDAHEAPAAGARARVRVALPGQLRQLARVEADVAVDVDGPVTVATVLDALEAAYPALQGTVRDRATGRRRPMIRLYAGGEDYSDTPGASLPPSVVDGLEPLRLVGAIAGG